MDLTIFTAPSARSEVITQAMDKRIAGDKNVDRLLSNIHDLISIRNIHIPFIAEMCAKKSIEIIQPCLPDIFTGSRCNPFRHAEFTSNLGELNQRVKEVKNSSAALAAMQRDIETIYMHMLKLRLVPEINLTTIPELDLHIASLLLRLEHSQHNPGRSEPTSNVRNLYCIHSVHTQKLPPFDGTLKIKEKANLRAFAQVIASVVNVTLKNLRSRFDGFRLSDFVQSKKEFKVLAPLLHFYAPIMCERFLFTESETLSRMPNLKQLLLSELSALPKLPHPEELQTLQIASCNDDGYTTPISEDDARLLLTFLTRCEALESLVLSGTPISPADLSRLPQPEKLKFLCASHLVDYTPEFLEKFVNLEKLYLLHAPQSMDGVATLPKLRKLAVDFHGSDFETQLQTFPRCSSVEKLLIDLGSSRKTFSETTLALILDKFPKLKTLNVNTRTETDINLLEQVLKERGITLKWVLLGAYFCQ